MGINLLLFYQLRYIHFTFIHVAYVHVCSYLNFTVIINEVHEVGRFTTFFRSNLY